VLLGLGGVAMLIGPAALAGLGLASLAQIAVLAAALSYACAGLYGRRFRGLPPSSAAAGMLTASTVLLLPLALVVERPWTFAPGPSTWAALLGLALLCTALAYLLYFRILATAGATNLLLVTFLIPPVALLLGAAFLGERPQWTAYAGMAIIFSGLAAVDGRPLQRLKTLTTSRTSAERTGSP
jgi:drug/metabolite transporter (DMT)-like permease